MPRAANATFLAFLEAQDSADDVFTANGSGVFSSVARVPLSVIARTSSGLLGKVSEAVCGFCGSVAGVSVTGAATGADVEDWTGSTGFVAVLTGSTGVFTAIFVPLSGVVTVSGFTVSETGVSTGLGASLSTVTVERISPSGDESVTAHSE